MTSRQQEQVTRHQKWIAEHGEVERPVQLATYMTPAQEERIEWISHRVRGTVLEVGCCYGYVTAAIDGTAGCDINPEAIGIAKKLVADKQFFVADATDIPMPDRTFDTVLLAEVLEHLQWGEVKVAIEEAKRVARRRIIITMPSGEEDTPEAINGKHSFLVTSERLDEIKAHFKELKMEFSKPFVYLVATAW